MRKVFFSFIFISALEISVTGVAGEESQLGSMAEDFRFYSVSLKICNFGLRRAAGTNFESLLVCENLAHFQLYDKHIKYVKIRLGVLLFLIVSLSTTTSRVDIGTMRIF